MSPSVILGLVFALGTALASIVGFLYKQRGAVDAPPVTWRHPIASTLSLFSSRWWTIGLIVATASWGLHVTALSLAPITLVQTVIAGGLVLLTVIADRAFGLNVSQREWIGVGLTAVGLAFLAATLGNEGSSAHNHYETATLAVYVGALTLVSLALCVSVARERSRGAGLMLATAAGLQWGVSDVTIKALSGHLHNDGVLVLINPLAAVILILSLVGLVVSARSLQLGEAVPVIAVTSAAANLVTIASGLVVFGEPLPAGGGAAAVRLLAFALVIAAAALTPAPAPRAP
jgi:drug/metabolite transporter (DMT)-like permease